MLIIHSVNFVSRKILILFAPLLNVSQHERVVPIISPRMDNNGSMLCTLYMYSCTLHTALLHTSSSVIVIVLFAPPIRTPQHIPEADSQDVLSSFRARSVR